MASEEDEEFDSGDEAYFASASGDREITETSRLNQDAEEAADFERKLTVKEAIRAYPMAIFWCLVISTCVIMEGYDTILIGNFFAYHTFQRKYGVFVGVSPTTQSGYQLTPAWQAILGNAAGAGAFCGTLINGYLVQLYGHRIVLLGALALLAVFVCMTFWAPNLAVLCAGEIMCGFPWGVFATAAPAYASEVLPMSLRVYFTSWTNMCFIIGQLVAAGVLRILSSRDDEWGFRLPFAFQWLWPTFLIPLIYFAPPSPYHEVQHGRIESAKKSLKRLQRASANIDVNQTLAAIIHTNNLEKELSVGTSYWDCFRGFEARRTEIACMCFVGQILSGSTFAYNSSYFFEQLGLAETTTYSLNLEGTALALVGTVCNWLLLMPYFGRRTVYIGGMLAMAGILFLIGILNAWNSSYAVSMTQALLTLLWTFVFQLSAGQLGWALSAEMGSTRLRQKTICLARNAYYLVGVIGGILQPYFMNPTAWNLRGYTGFVWGTTALGMTVWAFLRLPESRNRTYEELDILFANRVPARKFRTTNVHVFDDLHQATSGGLKGSASGGALGPATKLHDADEVNDVDEESSLANEYGSSANNGGIETIELKDRKISHGHTGSRSRSQKEEDDEQTVPLVSGSGSHDHDHNEHEHGDGDRDGDVDEFGDFSRPPPLA